MPVVKIILKIILLLFYGKEIVCLIPVKSQSEIITKQKQCVRIFQKIIHIL